MPNFFTDNTVKQHYPVLVRSDDVKLQISVSECHSIREALDCTELRVRAACGGLGTCGACLIQIVSGEFNPPTITERQKLLPEDLAKGIRLACQLRAHSPCELYLEHPAPFSQWKSIEPTKYDTCFAGDSTIERHPFGLAVDLGTTHIRLSLWNRQSGRHIASRQGLNPQVAYGADILTRLDANRLDNQNHKRLCREARKAVVDGLRDILSRDMGEITPVLSDIGKIVIVGNTVMLTLVCGGDSDALYKLENWHQAVSCEPDEVDSWRRQWHTPNADIKVTQPLAGFVGSDLLADLLACKISDQPLPALLTDFGTNTEIALWDGETVWVTSVPGGPAFEGVGMRNGLAADSGAIYKIGKTQDQWQLDTIGNTAARGFCASGFIDAVALLLQDNQLKPSGRFVQPQPTGFRFQPTNPYSAIFASDIDIFQRAKASTAAAVAQLLALAGLTLADIKRFWLCGSLGHHINPANAMRVGLLPEMPLESISIMSNASLAGCEQLLLTPNAAAQLSAITLKSKLINLGSSPDYERLFIENLRLQPLSFQS